MKIFEKLKRRSIASVVTFGGRQTLSLGGKCIGSALGAFIVLVQSTMAGSVQIDVQPSDVGVDFGKVAIFEVEASGSSSIQYQWFHNGDVIPGMTESALILNAVGMTNLGYYSVTAKSDQEVAVSRSARLTIKNRNPGTVWFANSKTIYEPDEITPLQNTNYVAELLTGPKPELLAVTGPTIHLSKVPGRFDGGSYFMPTVPPGAIAYAQIRVWDSQMASSFDQAITNGRFGQTRIVSFVAGGDFGPIPEFASFNLYENGAPKIALRPTPSLKTLVVGESADFFARSTGTPPLSYQWRKNGQILPNETNLTLSFKNATVSSSGKYTIEVSNALGLTTSSPAFLTVYSTNSIPGTLDKSVSIGSGTDAPISAFTEQPDGKWLIAGGFSQFDGTPVSNIARLYRDGSLDKSFVAARLPIGRVHKVWLNLLGQVYVAYNPINSVTLRVSRLQTDGSVDVTYSFTENVQLVNSNDLTEFYQTGAFLVRTRQPNINLLKFDVDGFLDSSFRFSGFSYFGLDQMLGNSDGSVWFSDRSSFASLEGDSKRFHILKLNPSGTIAIPSPHDEIDQVYNYLVADNIRSGKEVAAISSSYNKAYIFDENGNVDRIGKFEIGDFSLIFTMLMQKNGKIVLLRQDGFGRFDSYVHRYLPNGSEDRSFSTIFTQSYFGNMAVRNVALLKDGRVLVYGESSGAGALGVFHGDVERVPPACRSIRRFRSGKVSLAFDSQAGFNYSIESSVDFKSWVEVGRIQSESLVSTFDYVSQSTGAEFYRVRLLD